jgi:Shikimate kinase
MGSGKSTIGRLLAEKLDYDFADLDDQIVARYELSISEIFRRYGEERFRRLESSALRQTRRAQHQVIATGGGTPCHHDGMAWINKSGISIYLRLAPMMIADRLRGEQDQRPLVARRSSEELNDYIKQHLAERAPYYEEADLIIEAHSGIEELVTKIVADLKELED